MNALPTRTSILRAATRSLFPNGVAARAAEKDHEEVRFIAGKQEVSLEQSLNKLLQVAIKRRWWMLIPASAIALVACVISLLLPSRYESTATILVQRQQVPEHFVTPNTTVDVREALLTMTDAIISQTQLLRIIDEYWSLPGPTEDASRSRATGRADAAQYKD